MRQLRFVSLSEDGASLLVEASDGPERFALPIEAGLRTALDELQRGPEHRPPAAEPALAALAPTVAAPAAIAMAPVPDPVPPIGPREIQMRVRAGESPEELAIACGMALERVMRFAGPVLDERIRIADEARRARARRTNSDGGEPRVVVFGEAVDDRFAAHGIEAESVSWNSRRRDDGEWFVVAEWRGGAATHTAEWLFSRATRSVTPMDDTAADLLSDRPIRPVAPPAPTRPSLVGAPPLAPGVVAFPPMPEAHTSPLPVLDEVFDQEAPLDGPRELPVRDRPARELPARDLPAREDVPLVPVGVAMNYDEPPLPLGLTDAAGRPVPARTGGVRKLGAGRRDESEEEKAARARIPSWDDILLGIRRKED